MDSTVEGALKNSRDYPIFEVHRRNNSTTKCDFQAAIAKKNAKNLLKVSVTTFMWWKSQLYLTLFLIRGNSSRLMKVRFLLLKIVHQSFKKTGHNGITTVGAFYMIIMIDLFHSSGLAFTCHLMKVRSKILWKNWDFNKVQFFFINGNRPYFGFT